MIDDDIYIYIARRDTTMTMMFSLAILHNQFSSVRWVSHSEYLKRYLLTSCHHIPLSTKQELKGQTTQWTLGREISKTG